MKQIKVVFFFFFILSTMQFIAGKKDHKQKDLEMIYSKLSNSEKEVNIDFKTKYEEAFKTCDVNNKGELTKDEFINCTNINKVHFDNIIPQIKNQRYVKNNLILHGMKNREDYASRLYDLFVPKTYKIDYYGYMTVVLYNYAIKKCQNAPYFLYEKKFECLIQEVVPYRTLPHGTMKQLFNFCLKMSPSPEKREVDMPTFILVSLSMRLFAKINVRNNYALSKTEMANAAENGKLPVRYNEEIIKNMFELTNRNKLINIHSFVFYDIILKIYRSYESGRKNELNLDEFQMSLKHIFFPRRYMKILKHKDFVLKIIKMIETLKEKQKDQKKKKASKEENKVFVREEKTSTTSTNIKNSIADLSFKIMSYYHKGYITFIEYAKFFRFYFFYSEIDYHRIGKVKLWKIQSRLLSKRRLVEVDKNFIAGVENFGAVDHNLFTSPFYSFALVEGENFLENGHLTKHDPVYSPKVQSLIKLSKLKKFFKVLNIPYDKYRRYKRCEYDNQKNYDWLCSRSIGFNYVLSFL